MRKGPGHLALRGEVETLRLQLREGEVLLHVLSAHASTDAIERARDAGWGNGTRDEENTRERNGFRRT